jgi:hypothetical protein
VQPDRLWFVVRALHEARSEGLYVILVLCLATSPALLLPRLPAQLLCHVRTSLFKLQAPLEAMNAALRREQVRILVPTMSCHLTQHPVDTAAQATRSVQDACMTESRSAWCSP